MQIPLIAALALALSPHIQAVDSPAEAPVAANSIAAEGADSYITWAELDELLIARRAQSTEGRELLRHLAEVRLLEVLGAQNGLSKSDADIDAQLREIEAQILAEGNRGGLKGMLKEKRLSLEEFRRFLRLAAVQETLTKRALGKQDSDRVTGEQQKLWIDAALLERKYEEYNAPWKDGVVARCGEFTISADEFLTYLRRRLSEDTLREDCWQLLVAKRMKARMPDLAPERFQKAIAEELQRRRDDTKRDPRYKGATYESLLATQGILSDRMDRDPGVHIAALSKLWVERSYDDAALQRVYKDERELFDGVYGAAVDTSMIFLRAGAFKNDFNSRTFLEAEKILGGLRSRIRTLDDFRAFAKDQNEDPSTRESGGALGYITLRSTKVTPEIQAQIARALATPVSASAQESMFGPLRVANGCVLLWFGSRRPAPAWDAMSMYVKSELRRRFVEDVLPKSAVSGPLFSNE
ncbi:MAG: hypothetical protein JNL28_04135 [Planctomycetes bacterium]|nr:hypothetical protein [Planctomycetota bacterium]